MFGWTGRVLRVNLGEKTWKIEPIRSEDARLFIGARGLGTKYYIDEVDPTVDPLSPENKLIFATGPLTGTLTTSSGRYDVITKGPLTGTIAASNSGGFWGPELKYAGFDMVILEGKAKAPVYIYIYNDMIEIRDARHLWGKDVHSVTDSLLTETDSEAKVACIGPAGENLVKFACIMNEKDRAAGRSGVGAVMGSKNLKAIVVRGTKGVKVADRDAVFQSVAAARKKLKEHPVTSGGLPTFGTNVLVGIINSAGALPTRNFREAIFEGADKVSAETYNEKNLIKNKGCMGCPIGCGRVAKSNGIYVGQGEGPEYESTWSFGPDCGIDDIDAIVKANFICNELGMDTITLGSTIACAMELYEMGVLTENETGYDLHFGNVNAMVKLTEDTAHRRGFGDELAEGSWRLAEKWGHPELSMTVKKQEMPAYDPRALQGMGLEYATSNRGGCHVRGYLTSPEVLGAPEKIDPEDNETKPVWLKAFQDLTAALDSAGMCLFTTFALGAADIAPQLAAVTGVDYTEESFMQAGDRIWNLERLFNMKAGLSKSDDTLPPRLLKDPIPNGPMKGRVNRLDSMLPQYYSLRGWNEEGIPTEEKLIELGLASYL
ncbi:MAG: aldehyde ferredoxin oxidoreductase family protein [Aminobacterium sp.]|nr:aldehyde ferredoxin oxidoreductase family protein [Aminobacterium sp.]MDD4228024.1 aldehyde ferredoxin oxidoreductase family protein [Aminobacterium sp.]MDD4551129.1 aldehyde ferredoxin oxidoreductase family protein [Aminobacterium sp.]